MVVVVAATVAVVVVADCRLSSEPRRDMNSGGMLIIFREEEEEFGRGISLSSFNVVALSAIRQQEEIFRGPLFCFGLVTIRKEP